MNRKISDETLIALCVLALFGGLSMVCYRGCTNERIEKAAESVRVKEAQAQEHQRALACINGGRVWLQGNCVR